MNSLCAVLALLSFLLFAATTESRIGPGGYKDNALERNPMPENLWELMKEHSAIDNIDLSGDKDEKTDCDDLNNNGAEIEVAEFEVYTGFPFSSVVKEFAVPTTTRTGFESWYGGGGGDRWSWQLVEGAQKSKTTEFEVYPDDSEVTKSNIPEEKPKSNEDEVEWPKADAFYADFETKPYISIYNNN